MNYDEFLTRLKEDLTVQLEQEYQGITVETTTIKKLQKSSYTGLSVRKKDASYFVAFDAYHFYKMTLEGQEYETVLSDVLEFLHIELGKELEIDLQMLYDYRKVKELLAFELIGADVNREKLEDTPHKLLHDMAIAYRIIIKDCKGRNGSILITNKLLSFYDIDAEQLHEDTIKAVKNRKDVVLCSLEHAVGHFIRNKDSHDEQEITPAYVLTNTDSYYGASTILNTPLMDNIAEELGGNFYILPSSIHEVIIVPEDRGISASSLLELVTFMNKFEVRPEDILTDNVYRFNAATSEIELTANNVVCPNYVN